MSFEKKYLKYKNKYIDLKTQIGGDYNEILKQYPNCEALLREFYPDSEKIRTSKYIYDKFFTSENLLNIYEWYKTKNLSFSSMKDNKIEMREYNILLVNMLKDLYNSYIDNKKLYQEFLDNKNDVEIIETENQKKQIQTNINTIETILELFNITLIDYIYSNIITCVSKYLLFYHVDEKYKKECKNFLKYIDTPVILFPSFLRPTYYKVNLMMGSPVLNFYISKDLHMIHEKLHYPCAEIPHDLYFHDSYLSLDVFRQYHLELGNIYSGNINKLNTVPMIDMIDYYTYINNVLEIISPDIEYDVKYNNMNINDVINDVTLPKEEVNKYMKSLILFNIFHEHSFFRYIEKNSQINFIRTVKNFVKNNFSVISVFNMFNNDLIKNKKIDDKLKIILKYLILNGVINKKTSYYYIDYLIKNNIDSLRNDDTIISVYDLEFEFSELNKNLIEEVFHFKKNSEGYINNKIIMSYLENVVELHKTILTV